MKIAYILNAFPVLTQTWIQEEIKGLVALGEDVRVVALGETGPSVDPESWRELHARRWLLPTRSLTARLSAFGYHLRWKLCSPVRYLKTFLFVCTHFDLQAWMLFFAAPRIASRMRRAEIEWLHAHFADQGCEMAMLVSILTGIPYSFTPHAHDLWEEPRLLKEKVYRAAFVSTISRHNRRWCLEKLNGPHRDHYPLVRVGIDTRVFQPRQRAAADSEMSGSRPLRVVSVGRLVDYKGHDLLIRAAEDLDRRGLKLQINIIGEGPQQAELEKLISTARPGGLSVRLLGPLQHERVLEELSSADIFALACRRSTDGGMDGIPTALMEAMAMGLPVLTTRISGIPELVEDSRHGYLVEPDDPGELISALEKLAVLEPGERRSMGLEGRKKVEAEFNRTHEAKVLRDLIHKHSMPGE